MFSYEKFKAVEGSTFRLSGTEGTYLEVTLILAKSVIRAGRPAHLPDPFKLHFKGTQGIHLPQGNYRFDHPALEPCVFFIVPVAVDAETQEYTYEAIFN